MGGSLPLFKPQLIALRELNTALGAVQAGFSVANREKGFVVCRTTMIVKEDVPSA
jgi:hypothetical protein